MSKNQEQSQKIEQWKTFKDWETIKDFFQSHKDLSSQLWFIYNLINEKRGFHYNWIAETNKTALIEVLKREGVKVRGDVLKIDSGLKNGSLDVHYCAKCSKNQKFVYYHGWLGYESFVCSVCGFDVNDVSIQDLDNLANAKMKGGNK